MKLPRGVSGKQLVRMLERLGYLVVRQKGSHVRLHHAGPSQHTVTVPLHDPVKTGTLHGILSDVAGNTGIPLERLVELL